MQSEGSPSGQEGSNRPPGDRAPGNGGRGGGRDLQGGRGGAAEVTTGITAETMATGGPRSPVV